MKTLRFLLLIPFVLAFTSCIDDDGVDPFDDGDSRDVFVGSWNCVENEAKIAFTVNIIKDTASNDKILLENFAYIGMDEYATASILGATLTVPEQIPCEGYVVEGSGTLINEDEMQWTYTVTAGGDMVDYVATFTRM